MTLLLLKFVGDGELSPSLFVLCRLFPPIPLRLNFSGPGEHRQPGTYIADSGQIPVTAGGMRPSHFRLWEASSYSQAGLPGDVHFSDDYSTVDQIGFKTVHEVQNILS